MARADSYNKYGMRNVLAEHSRTAKEYKNHVDLSYSHLNFGYGVNDVSEARQAVKARCDEISPNRQAQTNVISEWVVTYPFTECSKQVRTDADGKRFHANVPNDMEHCKRFFDECYEFACERYGSDNVIGAYVHMDEVTPHIHILTVPVCVSRKTGRLTVSSASLLTRTELRKFHEDLQEDMNRVFGKNDYILNGRTEGDYTVEELKKRKKDKRALGRKAKELNERENAVKAREDKAEQDMRELAERKRQIEEQEKQLEDEKQALQTATQKIKELSDELAREQKWYDKKQRLHAESIKERTQTSIAEIQTALGIDFQLGK